MRICTYNAKGGVDRTTTTINLAGYFAQDLSLRVLVADCDPQGSALAWAALADETPFVVGRTRSRGFDIEITDMPPTLPPNGVLPEADIFVIPTLLNGVSFVVFLRTMELIRKRGLPCVVVANRVNPRRAEHRDRLQSEALRGAVVMRERAAFASYYAQGQTLFEMTGPYIQPARNEISQVAVAIEETLKGGRS